MPQEKPTEPEDSDEEEVVKKEYSNETFGVKFSYPTDWVIIEEEEEGDMALTLKIGNNANATEDIFLYEIKPSEPTFCIYSESELTVSDGATYEHYFDNYAKVGTDDLYRRSYSPYGTVNSYIICQEYEDGLYKNPKPGFITYWNFDRTDDEAEIMLTILDSILVSYEYIGDL